MRYVHSLVLENLGKTLNLGLSQLFTTPVVSSMFNLFVQYALFHTSPAAAEVATTEPVSVAHGLMESADASAGRDPRHSAELRAAALASLSVM